MTVESFTPRSLWWLARQESLISWRDLEYLITAGGRWRMRSVLLFLLGVAVIMHFIAYGMVARYAGVKLDAGTSAYTAISGSIGLGFFLMLSQALEQVTRLFYGRGDLELLKSSPVSLPRLFALRVVSIAISTTLMTLFVATPFIDVLVWRGGTHWLSAFGVAVAAGMATSGLALVLTAALFDSMGPRRTRLASQILAAVIGSAFIIAIQVVAILSIGSMSQQAFFQSETMIAHAPGPDSLVWIPARAILGDPIALIEILVLGLIALGLPMMLLADRLGEYALATAGAMPGQKQVGGLTGWFLGRFRATTARKLLHRKEWVLLLRDPWLASQSLMQLLYLIPPGIFLWRSYGNNQNALVIVTPVLTMAAGQLGGGLAWLAVSGEDAPDLIASAPLSPARSIFAKVEAVVIAVSAIFLPFLIAIATLSWRVATIVAIGIGIATVSSTLIQVWFRSQAKRRFFRRRQTSSRIATFAEAFSSVAWASAAAVAAGGSWFALGPALIAMLVLAGAWMIRPK
jgi:ABC-2 type transport system permease protein